MHDKIRPVNQAANVDNKHLDAALAMAKAMQQALPPRKRNRNEPGRKAQPGHMFPAMGTNWGVGPHEVLLPQPS